MPGSVPYLHSDGGIALLESNGFQVDPNSCQNFFFVQIFHEAIQEGSLASAGSAEQNDFEDFIVALKLVLAYALDSLVSLLRLELAFGQVDRSAHFAHATCRLLFGSHAVAEWVVLVKRLLH